MTTPPNDLCEPGSFRDSAGFIFRHEDTIYRAIARGGQSAFNLLHSSGLYEKLTAETLLVRHETTEDTFGIGNDAIIIKPEQVPFISYSYEWAFSQLKAAALCTLEIQRIALEQGMCLRDASAYNIQFINGRPICIDTLSLGAYQEGKPWVAYQQFCRHFLAPLALMAFCDCRLGLILRDYIDGIPLDLASRLLPFRTRFRLSLLMHLHLHAKAIGTVSRKKAASMRTHNAQFSKHALQGLVESLRSAVMSCELPKRKSFWSSYYDAGVYSRASTDAKLNLVSDCLDSVRPKTVWDMGANTGKYSILAAQKGCRTIAFDFDPLCVEACCRTYASEKLLLPLILDLTNPSPGLGWNNRERKSFVERGSADMVLALALIHHLAIGNNVPLPMIASFFASFAQWLILEFVPKNDPQVVEMLSHREDIFSDYSSAACEESFSRYFNIRKEEMVGDSDRILYLMERA